MRLPIVLIAPLVLACGLAGPGASNQPTTPPTVSPAPTIAPTAPATDPSTSAPTVQASDTLYQPPDGLLAAGGDPVAGWLGTFCWYSRCLDAGGRPPKPDLPSLSADSAQMTFALADDAPFHHWSAVYYPDSNSEESEPLGSGGTGYDPDSSASPPPALYDATFAAPPSGDWVVVVFVLFEEGDAGYAWHVTVP